MRKFVALILSVMSLATLSGCVVYERPAYREVVVADPPPPPPPPPPVAVVEVVPVRPYYGAVWVGGGYVYSSRGYYYRHGYWR
jgi:hypothetical protein